MIGSMDLEHGRPISSIKVGVGLFSKKVFLVGNCTNGFIGIPWATLFRLEKHPCSVK